MTIGEKIKNLRIEKGLSVLEFAQLLEVTERTVYRWESNSNPPSNTFLVKIAHKCNVDISYFETNKKALSASKVSMIISFIVLCALTIFSLVGFIVFSVSGTSILNGLSFDTIIAMLILSFGTLACALVYISLKKS